MGEIGDDLSKDPLAKLVDASIEQSFLGSCLLNNAVYERCADHVRADDFGYPVHGRIYAAIGSLVEKGYNASPVTLKSVLADDLASPGGAGYLGKLMGGAVAPSFALGYAAQISDLSRRRKLIEVCNDTIADAAIVDLDRPARSVIEDHEQRVFELAERGSERGPVSVSVAVREAIKSAEDAHRRGSGVSGVTTGLADLDRLIGGLLPGNLEVIAGRPSMGKTSLAAGMLYAAARSGIPAAAFSLEETGGQLAQRLLAIEARVGADRQRRGDLSHIHWAELIDAQQALDQLPITIDDSSGLSAAQIVARARRLRRRANIGLVIIDHLQHVRTSGKSEKRYAEIGAITRALKGLAKDIGIPVVLLSQLSRANESRDNKRPMLSDLRECVAGDTLVNLADGRRVPIAELVGASPDVVAVRNGRLCVASASQVWAVGERDTWHVRLASGRSIKATGRHRLYGAHGWTRVSDFSTGDRLAISRRASEPKAPKQWPDAHCILLAHLIGDGSYLPHQPLRYTTASPHCSEAVRTAAENAFCARVSRHEGRGKWHQLVIAGNGNRWTPAGVGKWLRELEIFGQRSSEKRVPADVFALSNDQVALFLRHLWATDGHIAGGNAERRMGPCAYLATASHGLALDVAALLLRFGIVARISKIHAVYGVWIKGVDFLMRFLSEIGTFGPRVIQGEALKSRLAGRVGNTNVDTLPIEIFDTIREQMRERGISQRAMAAMRGTSYGGQGHFGFAPSRDVVMSYGSLLNSRRLTDVATNDLFWDAIVSIEPAGREVVYDLTVPGPHSWLADGVVSHNSGDIEQDADRVMFVYREEYYLTRDEPARRPDETDEKFNDRYGRWRAAVNAAAGIGEIIVSKNRHGPTNIVRVHWDAELTMFGNLAR